MTPHRKAPKLTSSSRKKFSPMNKNDPRKALGKGIHSLLPPKQGSGAGQAPAAASSPPGPARLPIHQVNPNPNQPRRDFDETALSELKQSISREGVLQPL